MTETQSFALLQASEKSARSDRFQDASHHTIYRDAPLSEAPFSQSDLYATDDSDRVAPLLQIGLAALLLPTLAYAWSVLGGLIATGTLEKAIRAFLP